MRASRQMKLIKNTGNDRVMDALRSGLSSSSKLDIATPAFSAFAFAAKEVEPLALGIAAWHKTQAPAGESPIVFRDSAFADDVAKTNLTAILQQHGLENVRSL